MAATTIATLITRLIIIRAREAVAVLLILLRMGMCIRSRAELGTFEGGGGGKIMGDGLKSVGLVSEVGRLTHVVDRFKIEIEGFLSHLLCVKLAHLEQRVSQGFLIDCKASCMFASKRWIPSCSVTPAEDAATWFVNFGQPIPWEFLLPLLPLLFPTNWDVRTVPLFLDLPHLSAGRDVSCVPVTFSFLQLKMHSSRWCFIPSTKSRTNMVYQQSEMWDER
jgi:hypothetical protein